MSSSHSICSICCEEYSQEKLPVELKCKHIYHNECIKQWNDQCSENHNQSLCPLCKQIFNPLEIKINQGLLSQILKAYKPIKLQVQLMKQNEVEINIHPSKTIKDLFDQILIYENNPQLNNKNIQITIKQGNEVKVYNSQDNNSILNDLHFENNSKVITEIHKDYFQVFIKPLTGGQHLQWVTSSMKIKELGKILSDQSSIPVNQMRATINSKPLDFVKNGDKQLSDFNVKAQTNIHILGRMLGGIL